MKDCTVPKLQQDPQTLWSLTGVTAPYRRQSRLSGASAVLKRGVRRVSCNRKRARGVSRNKKEVKGVSCNKKGVRGVGYNIKGVRGVS
jgi:hypothetical protein